MNNRKINWFTIIPLTLISFFFVFQLYVLTNVGDNGQKITQLKNKQSELKIQNEILKAKILDLQTDQAVVLPLTEKVKVEKKAINVIDIGYASTSTAMK